MASHDSYSIPILNELHALYPDILYRPSQFQTSNDVIQYILDRGVRRRFRQESGRYQARYQESYISNNLPRHSPFIEEYNVELYSEVPVISNPSSIEQLLSYFLRENRSDEPVNERPANERPTEEHLRTHTIVLPIVDENNTTCAICQDTLNNGQMARQLHHCHHLFHQSCIDTWFESHVTCPTCRHDIRLA